jgi:hypothetical protein
MWVPVPVRDVQLRRFRPSQTPPVNDLEQGRVPVCGQRSFPAAAGGVVDLIVGVIEEPLQLDPGEGPTAWVSLVLGQMSGGVPFVTALRGVGAELFFAHGRPVIK